MGTESYEKEIRNLLLELESRAQEDEALSHFLENVTASLEYFKQGVENLCAMLTAIRDAAREILDE